MNKQIGIINNKVIRLLNLDYDDELPIYIGEDNIKHMQKEHSEDYNKYRRQNTRYFK